MQEAILSLWRTIRKQRHGVAECGTEIHTEIATPVHSPFHGAAMFKDTSFLSRMAPKPEPISVVYFISAKDRPFPVKIGRTTNFLAAARLTQLQIGCPYALEFFAAVEAPADYERELHDEFAKSAMRGEWFSRTPALIRLIDNIQRENRHWRALLRAPRTGGITTNDTSNATAGGSLSVHGE